MSTTTAVAPPRSSALPTVPRAYHEFYRTPRFRWWHSVVGLIVFAFGWGLAVLVVTIGAVAYEMSWGGRSAEQISQGDLTPALFLANNVGVALAIPVAVATHRVVYGQRAGWLFSIVGRFRWGLLGRFLAVAAGIHTVALLMWLVTMGPPDDLHIRPASWFLLAVVVLTTPFQAAGEEVAFRGIATRAVGSWFGVPLIGLVVSTAVTAALFVLVHGAADLTLNVFYLCLAVGASVLTWHTGGLEAAVALHVVVNLTTMLFVPFLGLAGFFDRQSGSGGTETLAQIAALLLTAAALSWQAHRARLPLRAVPSRAADKVRTSIAQT